MISFRTFVAVLVLGLPCVTATAGSPSREDAALLFMDFSGTRKSRAQFVEQIKSLFSAVDLDRDGFVTVKDLKIAQEQSQEKLVKYRLEWLRRLLAHDLNADGVVTFDEIHASALEMVEATAVVRKRDYTRDMGERYAKALAEALRPLDVNRDGRISLMEAVPYIDAAFAESNSYYTGNHNEETILKILLMGDGASTSLEQFQKFAVGKYDEWDLNHDGKIDGQEWEAAARSFRPGGSDHKLEHQIDYPPLPDQFVR